MDKKFDVVIVGTGAAGLYAALNFPESVNILLVSKRELQLSNSSLAQGGVACVLDTVHDSYKLHITDTLIAGKYKNTLSAVEKLVTEGPSDVLKIKDLGVDFDLNEDGTMCKTLEAGHSRNRIVHHKDSTGKAIVDGLIAKVTQLKNVTVCDNALVYSIDKVLNGFYISILRNGEKLHYGCNYCLLATGGIGRVYKYTTNSAIATGDGIAFAYMLGARIKNLSRIQFHPTAFAADHGRERFLISEAVRGEGAVLLNCNGERFASNYDSRGELAPRDVVSNAVMLESIKTNSENFYLDITHKPADFVRNRFPMIYERCLEEGVDNYGWNLLAQQSGEFTQAKGQEVMESFLKSYDDIDVVICENDNEAFGAIDAIKAAGKTCGPEGDIIVVSFDSVKAAFESMIAGDLNATFECNPLHGPRVAEIIQKLEKGEEVEKIQYVDEAYFDTSMDLEEILKTRAY